MATIEATGTAGNRQTAHRKPVALWLFACCGMVAVMMLIGAATRLTESGLSMVEWRPLIGWLPPLSDAARSEEHTSELQSLMRISYAVFCLKKKKKKTQSRITYTQYIMPYTKTTTL